LDDNYGKKIVFSPDRKQIALYSLGYGGITIYDGDTGEFLYTLVEYTDAYTMETLSFSPDGTSIVFSTDDYTIRILDLETSQEKFILNGHIGTKLCANYSPDGRFITSYSRLNGELWIWDAQTGEQLHIINTNRIEGMGSGDFYNVGCGVFSPDGRTLAFSVGGTIRIWGIPPSSTP
ncbi:MAG TPA: hypothetical protein PLZ51_19385, partial [Aggregatilineales bacterium]|nr:hypothetical protein [Aggregatilineales bacterium]